MANAYVDQKRRNKGPSGRSLTATEKKSSGKKAKDEGSGLNAIARRSGREMGRKIAKANKAIKKKAVRSVADTEYQAQLNGRKATAKPAKKTPARSTATRNKGPTGGSLASTSPKAAKPTPQTKPKATSSRPRPPKKRTANAAGASASQQPQSIAQARKMGKNYFIGKDGKRKAAVTAEQLKAWEKRTGKKGLRAYLNAKGK